MPAIARVPIQHAVFVDGKISKEKSLSFGAGDYISDEQLKIVDPEDRRLIIVPHHEHICPPSCPDKKCSDERAARADALKQKVEPQQPAKAAAGDPQPSLKSDDDSKVIK